jgi:hypothetical protein
MPFCMNSLQKLKGKYRPSCLVEDRLGLHEMIKRLLHDEKIEEQLGIREATEWMGRMTRR